jgi:hypothetical protein
MLNVFNNVNFVPQSGTTQVPNNSLRWDGSDPDGYDITQLVTGNQARILQLVGRIRW